MAGDIVSPMYPQLTDAERHCLIQSLFDFAEANELVTAVVFERLASNSRRG